MNFRKLIYVWLVVIAIVPVLLLSSIHIVAIDYWSKSLIQSNLETTAFSYKAIIEDFFTQLSIDMSILGYSNEVRTYFISKDTEKEKSLPAVNSILQAKVKEKYYFDFIVLYNEKGERITSTIPSTSINKLTLPSSVLTSTSNDLVFSEFNKHPLQRELGIINAYFPINDSHGRVGYLNVGFNTTYFSHIIENISLKNKTKYKVRLQDSQNNVLSTLGTFVYKPGQANNFEDVIKKIDFAANPKGLIYFDNYKNQEVAYYVPIDGTKFMLFSAVNKSDYRFPVRTIIENVSIVIGLVLLIVIIIMMGIGKAFDRFMETIMMTIDRIKDGDFHARFPVRGKYEIRDVIETFNDLLSTIEHHNNELYHGSERYRMVIRMFSDLFFEADVLQDFIEFGNNKWTLMYQLHEMTSYHQAFLWIHDNYIFEEDKKKFRLAFDRASMMEHMNQMKQSVSESVELEFRWLHPNETYIWVSLIIVPIFDQKGESHRIIGYMKNIDHKKHKELDLLTRAQQDGLTKVNNKVTTQAMIDEILSTATKESQHAFLMIDLDDFKLINDSFGHLSGDIVLKEVSSLMLSMFVGSVVGRIGGDEFVVFLKDVSRKEATKLVNRFLHQISVNDSEIKGSNVSCSIGIAFYPQHGTDYLSLFTYADRALYISKDVGKNTYHQ